MHEVVIVGGGAAGIGAARRLAEAGIAPLLIEAGPQLGGRATSQQVEGMMLDLGCAWLHSAERNQWAEIAAQRGIAIDKRPPGWGVQYRDLGFSPAAQQQASAALEGWIAALAEHPPASDCAADALPASPDWHAYIRAIVGYISGADPSRISAADFTAYDQASSDANWRMKTGYGWLVTSSLPAGTVARCNTALERLSLEGSAVRLDTNAGTLQAKTVILTVSTAVLAGDMIRLPSALDAWRHAAALLPLGCNEKLFFALAPEAGLAAETRLLGNPRDADTGVHNIRPFGWPVIETFLGGGGALRVTREGADAAFARAMDQLASLLGADIRRHIRPLLATGWRSMARIGGGYSCALPGAAPQRLQLAKPFEERVFFAGEATHQTDFSTAHGALASGIRAAEEALAALK